MNRRSVLLGASAATLLAGRAGAQNGPVTLVVPYAREGSADIFARAVAPGLSQELGQPVTVENRPGGGGTVGLNAVAQAAPDGRTLLLGQTGEIVVQPYLMRQAGPRPEPVALVAVIPLAVVVASSSPFNHLRDLVAAGFSNPRGISVASPGRLTPGDLAIELLRGRTSAKLASVPFDGGGPALTAVADGLVDTYFSTLTSAMPYLRAGKVKILAVTTPERSPALPDVPTMSEAGVRRFTVSQWAGVFAPRGTPGDLVTRLNAAVNKVLAQPEVNGKVVADGGKVTALSPAQFADFIRADGKVYADLLAAELCSEYSLETCSGPGGTR